MLPAVVGMVVLLIVLVTLTPPPNVTVITPSSTRSTGYVLVGGSEPKDQVKSASAMTNSFNVFSAISDLNFIKARLNFAAYDPNSVRINSTVSMRV